jgi:type I restriction-modification system DNA methylase subunit
VGGFHVTGHSNRLGPAGAKPGGGTSRASASCPTGHGQCKKLLKIRLINKGLIGKAQSTPAMTMPTAGAAGKDRQTEYPRATQQGRPFCLEVILMELSELTKAVCRLLDCEKGTIVDSIRDTIFSDRKNDILAKYFDLIGGNLKTDELQKIFQYYYADRKEKCQDFTPKSIAKLLASEVVTGAKSIYDMCAGSGALTIQAWAKNKDAIFYCEELDDNAVPVLLFNLALRNISGYVIHRDVLTMKEKAIYRLIAGEKFSQIEQAREAPEISADAIISNPPYNVPWSAPEPLFADKRFKKCTVPSASNANYAFVLTALDRLSENGRCAFVLPCGVLTSTGPDEEIRKYLCDNRLLEKVIALPGHMFEATDIPTCILAFSRGNRSVSFFDCRQKAEREDREQKGQFGGAGHTGRTYHKMINVLPDELIDVLCSSAEDVPGFSVSVFPDEIAKQGYILTPTRYIRPESEENNHRPYADIIDDINRISRERSILKITVNETLAKQLGLNEIANVEQQNPDLDKAFSLFGEKYERRRFIQLSKNKNELKIENQDKELFSSLFEIFIPMWKQHVFYLNQEENRLLAELRDAMLPDLMSGKLQVS